MRTVHLNLSEWQCGYGRCSSPPPVYGGGPPLTLDVICATYGQRSVTGWVIVTPWVIVTCRVIGVTAANRAIRDCGMVHVGIPVPCGVWGYRCRPAVF